MALEARYPGNGVSRPRGKTMFVSQRHTRNSLLLAVAMGWVQAAVAAPASPTTAGKEGITDKQIIVGSCCDLEGPVSLIGQQQLAGAKAYISSVNDHGGVHGRKIEVLSYNDNY